MVVPIVSVMEMMVAMVVRVAVARISVIVVIAWIDVGIPVVALVIGIVSVEIVVRVLAPIVAIAPAPVRRFDHRAAVGRNFGAARHARDRRSRSGHCPEHQGEATDRRPEPMLYVHGLSSLVGGDAYAPTHLLPCT